MRLCDLWGQVTSRPICPTTSAAQSFWLKQVGNSHGSRLQRLINAITDHVLLWVRPWGVTFAQHLSMYWLLFVTCKNAPSFKEVFMLSTYYEPASRPHSVTIRIKGMKKSEQSGKTDSFISRISPFLLKNTLKNYIHIDS